MAELSFCDELFLSRNSHSDRLKLNFKSNSLETTTFLPPLHDTTQIHHSLKTHSQTSREIKNLFLREARNVTININNPTVTMCCKLMEDILACSKRAVSFPLHKKLLYSLSWVFSILFSYKLLNTNYTSSHQHVLTYKFRITQNMILLKIRLLF